jgi:DNA-binding Lrp family transcriptional regulator
MADIRMKRVRKLDLKSRRAIAILYKTGEWTMRDLADKFQVSAPRICQIINDTYGEGVMKDDEEGEQ